MAGLFHTLKKTVLKGDARPDQDFLDAKARFEQYADTVVKLKGNLNNYLNHATSLYITSSQISADFSTLIEDAEGTGTSWSEGAASLRAEHQNLASEQVPQLQQTFQRELLGVLDEIIMANSDINKRIAKRTELAQEVAYYQKKVNELRDERDKRAAKGKSESSSDLEKFDRNQRKLLEVEQTFSDLNNRLMADIERIWSSERAQKMAPIMKVFVGQEKKFAMMYSEALNNVRV